MLPHLAIAVGMKRLSLIVGISLMIATFVWFFYLVPLGCGMNPTGCRERFSVWSRIGMINFWLPQAVAVMAIAFGGRTR